MNTFNRRAFLNSSVRATSAAAGLTALSAGLSGTRAALFAGENDPAASLRTLGKTPHTLFAANIEMWWTKLSFLERIRKAAELGYPAVEFWPWQKQDIPAVAKLAQELNIVIAQFTAWGFTPGLNDPANHKKFLADIEAGCKVAKQLDCKMMTVVGGNDQPGMTQEQMHANIIKGLKLAAPIAEDHNVTLILESMNIRVDHKGHCLYGSTPAIRICHEVGSSHVKINWDLYHMQISEGDLCGHLREGFKAGYVGYLQVADNPGRHEPGTGEVHFNRVLKEAWNLGYRYYVGLECKPLVDEVTAAKRVAAADVW